jgi:hypothetical protein
MNEARSFYINNGPRRRGKTRFFRNHDLSSSMKAKERQNEHDHYDQAYKINQTVHDCLPGGAILQPLTATSPDKFHIVNRANGRGYPPLSLGSEGSLVPKSSSNCQDCRM